MLLFSFTTITTTTITATTNNNNNNNNNNNDDQGTFKRWGPGLEEVRAMASYRGEELKLHAGNKMVKTIDFVSTPASFIFICADAATLKADYERVHVLSLPGGGMYEVESDEEKEEVSATAVAAAAAAASTTSSASAIAATATSVALPFCCEQGESAKAAAIMSPMRKMKPVGGVVGF